MSECNQYGIALIKSFEKCVLKSYQDEGGVWTIGWGHTGPEVAEGRVITQDQADALFLDDLYERAEAVISSLVTVPLSDNQFSALCSFVYNIGAGHFKASSALHILNNGDLGNVPAHIMLWDEAGGQVSDGLILRRQAEVNLWSTPDDNA